MAGQWPAARHRALNFLDSGLAVTPEEGNPGRDEDLLFNQRFPKAGGEPPLIYVLESPVKAPFNKSSNASAVTGLEIKYPCA